MSIIARRSFVKGLVTVLAAAPIPGVLKSAISSIVPAEATLEDAEAILHGLIARVRSAPINLNEAGLICSFLKKLPTTDEQADSFMENLREYDASKWDERQTFDDVRGIPYAVRFWGGITKRLQNEVPFYDRDWGMNNFRALHKAGAIMEVVEVFKHPRLQKFVYGAVEKANNT